MESPTAAVGLGEILWDMLPMGRQLGGAPTNFAYHLNSLGVPTVPVSAVGVDELGDDIRAQVANWGLSTEFLAIRPEYPTGTVTVALDAAGIPSYEIHTGVAWDHLPWTEALAALAPTLRAVCYGTLGQRSPESHATIQSFLSATTPECLRVCDINLRQSFYSSALIQECLTLASVLKLNHEELPIIAEACGVDSGTELETLTRLCERFDLRLVALTRGDKGSLLVTPTATSEFPGIKVNVVDTIGAGDAFTAALVAGLLSGDSLEAINLAANQKAAEVCQHAGAIPGAE
ncbi:MAG: carbohydrate kinase [Armatimonas sp.]